MTAIQGAPTLAAAQSRFMQAVRQGITQLMTQCGYSRERATAALLRELGRGDAPPKNDEVFDTMTTFGLGVDDASQALTVSRAVRRAMKERGMSAVEAIDDLSSKLNITKLVTSGGADEQHQAEEQPLVSSRPSSPQQQRAAPTPTPATADRVSSQRKGRKATTTKNNHKSGKQKALKRKRSAPSSDDSKQKFSSRERADSVTEAVEAKAKKARLSPEDSPTPEGADTTIIVRKRNSVRGEQDAQSNTV